MLLNDVFARRIRTVATACPESIHGELRERGHIIDILHVGEKQALQSVSYQVEESALFQHLIAMDQDPSVVADGNPHFEFFRMFWDSEPDVFQSKMQDIVRFFHTLQDKPILLALFARVVFQLKSSRAPTCPLPTSENELYGLAFDATCTGLLDSPLLKSTLQRIAIINAAERTMSFSQGDVRARVSAEEYGLWLRLASQGPGVPFVRSSGMSPNDESETGYEFIDKSVQDYFAAQAMSSEELECFWGANLELVDCRLNDDFHSNMFRMGGAALGTILANHGLWSGGRIQDALPGLSRLGWDILDCLVPPKTLLPDVTSIEYIRREFLIGTVQLPIVLSRFSALIELIMVKCGGIHGDLSDVSELIRLKVLSLRNCQHITGL